MNPLRPALLLLLALLCGCSAYEAVFHPYRLPTPEPSPEFKRQLKAKKLADKTRGKASRAKKPASADPDATAAADAAPPDRADAAEASQQPANSKSSVKYDKGGLMKKPKLLRRRITKPTAPGGGPIQSIRNFFKYKLHGKHKPKPKQAPADGSPADAAPADAEPTPDK